MNRWYIVAIVMLLVVLGVYFEFRPDMEIWSTDLPFLVRLTWT